MIRKLGSGEYRLYSRKLDPRTGLVRDSPLQLEAVVAGANAPHQRLENEEVRARERHGANDEAIDRLENVVTAGF